MTVGCWAVAVIHGVQSAQEEMRRVCDDILKVKPDLVITEKGVSAHQLSQS